jgi:hypothetical protein
MFAIENRLLAATMLLLVLLLILFDKRHEVEWTLLDEDDFTILNSTISIVLFLYNATLTNTHRLEAVITTDFN